MFKQKVASRDSDKLEAESLYEIYHIRKGYIVQRALRYAPQKSSSIHWNAIKHSLAAVNVLPADAVAIQTAVQMQTFQYELHGGRDCRRLFRLLDLLD